MGFYNWTLRQKAKVAIPVVIAATFALQNLACQSSTDITVVNQSDVELRFAESVKRCEQLDASTLPASYWTSVPAGSEMTLVTYEYSHCFVVEEVNGSASARSTFYENSRYVINVSGQQMSIATQIGEPEDSSRFVILTSILGVPVLLGMVGAAFITLRFFFRYYIRRDKTAQLQ